MIKPTNIIYPDGGEPLYEEPGSGLRFTAQDFAAAYGYESTKAFLDALGKPVFLAALNPSDFEEDKTNG